VTVELRPATSTDAAALSRLHAEVHRITYAPLIGSSYVGLSPAALRAEWNARLAGGNITLLANGGDRLLGFCHAEHDRIELLYVASGSQRQGIGKALLRAVLDRLRCRSVEAATLNVLATNAEAIAFYETRGARRIGTEVMTDAAPHYLDIVLTIDTAAP
jgi:ribosomal protein S18 acetylase RimI-like enzyme